MARNTSQDPDYVGPVGHEKKFHKTHFGAPDVVLVRHKNGDTKKINGTMYVWKDGKWTPQETPTAARTRGGKRT